MQFWIFGQHIVNEDNLRKKNVCDRKFFFQSNELIFMR